MKTAFRIGNTFLDSCESGMELWLGGNMSNTLQGLSGEKTATSQTTADEPCGIFHFLRI